MIPSRSNNVPSRILIILANLGLTVLLLAGPLAIGACSGPTSIPTADKDEVVTPTLNQAIAADANPVQPASEAIVRQRLNALFRKHQLRIVNDYHCSTLCFGEETSVAIEVTLDGYDPETKVGYEYLAANEVGLDLDSDEEETLRRNPRIFVASANAVEPIEKQAIEFLQNLPGVSDTLAP